LKGRADRDKMDNMQNVTMSWARDLSAPVKAALENLLGRPLQDDELVSLRVYKSHEAPLGEARRDAARTLEEQLDRMAGKVKDVPQNEFETAIDEALEQARPKRR
jgi:hypothetical protein